MLLHVGSMMTEASGVKSSRRSGAGGVGLSAVAVESMALWPTDRNKLFPFRFRIQSPSQRDSNDGNGNESKIRPIGETITSDWMSEME